MSGDTQSEKEKVLDSMREKLLRQPGIDYIQAASVMFEAYTIMNIGILQHSGPSLLLYSHLPVVYGWFSWITQPQPTNLKSWYLGKLYKIGFKKWFWTQKYEKLIFEIFKKKLQLLDFFRSFYIASNGKQLYDMQV
jgi:hypothetical protein